MTIRGHDGDSRRALFFVGSGKRSCRHSSRFIGRVPSIQTAWIRALSGSGFRPADACAAGARSSEPDLSTELRNGLPGSMAGRKADAKQGCAVAMLRHRSTDRSAVSRLSHFPNMHCPRSRARHRVVFPAPTRKKEGAARRPPEVIAGSCSAQTKRKSSAAMLVSCTF